MDLKIRHSNCLKSYFSLEMPKNGIEKLLFLSEDIEKGYVRKNTGMIVFVQRAYNLYSLRVEQINFGEPNSPRRDVELC